MKSIKIIGTGCYHESGILWNQNSYDYQKNLEIFTTKIELDQIYIIQQANLYDENKNLIKLPSKKYIWKSKNGKFFYFKEICDKICDSRIDYLSNNKKLSDSGLLNTNEVIHGFMYGSNGYIIPICSK